MAGTFKRDQHTERALAEARHRRDSGLSDFVITVHSTDGGLALMPRLTPHVVSALQDDGFNVVGVTEDAWAYNAHISIRTPAASRPADTPDGAGYQGGDPYSSITAAPPGSLDGVSLDSAAYNQLAPFSTRAMVGVPFYSAFGAQQALKVAWPYFAGAAFDTLIVWSRGMANIVGGDVARDQVEFEDWDSVLGHAQGSFARVGLGASELSQARKEMDQFRQTLIQIPQQSGQLYNLWRTDRGFNVLFFVWASVINERLAAVGRTSSLLH